MSNNNNILNNANNENNAALANRHNIDALQAVDHERKGLLTDEAKLIYLRKTGEMKAEYDQLAAEVKVRTSRMGFINEIQAAINSATTEEHELDLTNQEQLQLKLKRAVEEFGVDLPIYEGSKMKYTARERDRLIQNLDLAAKTWIEDNKSQQQKMDVLMRESNMLMTMLTSTKKEESNPIMQMARNLKG